MIRRWPLLFVAVCLLWGIPYAFIKVAVSELSPVVVIFARAALAAAVLVPLALRRAELWASVREGGGALVGVALLQMALPGLLIAYGERSIASSLTAVLIAAEPVVVAVLVGASGESGRIRMVRWAGLLVGLAGVAVALGFDDARHQPFRLLGAAAVLGATVCYAAGTLLAAKSLSVSSPLAVSSAATAMTALGVAPVAVVNLPHRVPSMPVIASLLILGLCCTAAAFVVYYALLARVGPRTASVSSYIEPLVAVMFGVVFLHEPFTVSMALGLVLILAGSWWATRDSPAASGAPRRS